MDTIVLVGKIITCIFAVVIIALVLMQKNEEGASGSAFGQSSGSSSYLSKMKGKTLENRLKLWTKIAFVLFLVVTFAILIIQKLPA